MIKLKSIVEQIKNENIDAFNQDLKSQMKGMINKIKHSDYAAGDEIFTVTGAPVTFVSDSIPDRKTGEQRAIVKDRDGATYGIYLKSLTPEQPSKETALGFMAGKYKKYEEFVDAAARRGYDESDGLQQIWDQINNK
jgi:hypothetical protein